MATVVAVEGGKYLVGDHHSPVLGRKTVAETPLQPQKQTAVAEAVEHLTDQVVLGPLAVRES